MLLLHVLLLTAICLVGIVLAIFTCYYIAHVIVEYDALNRFANWLDSKLKKWLE